MGQFVAWLATRPECVQKLAKEFPLEEVGVVGVNGELLHLCGYTENDMLIFSTVDPRIDYERCLRPENKRYICASHFREPGGDNANETTCASS